MTLRAGQETGEWAHGRPDVQGVVRHQRPPVALESRIQGAVSGSYSVYQYLAQVDLPDIAHIDAVSARSLLPGVTAHLQGLSLAPLPDTRFDGQGGRGAARSPTATPAPGRPWRGGRWRGSWTARSTPCWRCGAPLPGPPGGH